MDWAAITGMIAFMGGACLILAFGGLFMEALYKFFPPYKKWVNKQIDNMPDWDEEVEK